MASFSFTHFLSLPRCQCHWASVNSLSLSPPSLKFPMLESARSPEERKWRVNGRKKKAVEGMSQEAESLGGNEIVVVAEKKKNKTPEESSDVESLVSDSGKEAENAPRKTRKKAVPASSADLEKKPQGRRKAKDPTGEREEVEEVKTEKKARGRKKKIVVDESITLENDNKIVEEEEEEEEEKKPEKKVVSRGRKKKIVVDESITLENDNDIVEEEEEKKPEKKVVSRGRKKKTIELVESEPVTENEEEEEESEIDEPMEIFEQEEEEVEIEEGEDISQTYGWPPLVCCFGAAQHAFVPCGRRAHRLVNHEIQESMKEAYWAPEKFVRAPGGSAGSVAIALASLGGKVAFMGKLGTDDFGEAMLYYMNFNGVQTRSVKIDGKRATAATCMRISKRGRLRTTCVRTCAEDSLTKTEINVDVLKEAKIFYCSTHSLLDPNMRSTTLRAIKISKKLGGLVFYDVNLPMPLWHSREEAMSFVQQVWTHADIAEITKQELEFLLGIETSSEEFDTKNNASAKFVHYGPEVVAPLFHENLKVLFVTNGTSKIHYYTAEHNGAVKGMEDPALTPFTSDMSASGDGIIAGILRMLAVQLELVTDKGYLERTIKFAINCGVIDQWALGRVTGFPPREGSEAEVETDSNGITSVTEMEYRTVENRKPSVDATVLNR